VATPARVTIRAARRADLEGIGRLGALLVRMHHDFDPERFLAATPHTERGYARFLATIAALEARGAPRVVLSTAERNEGAQRLFARAGFRQTMIEMTRERGGDSV
jgi:hypothetical protein